MNLRDQISLLLDTDEGDHNDENIKGYNEAVNEILALFDRKRTFNELAEQTYPGVTFDTALPQQWVNRMAYRGFDVRGHFVTLYPKDSIAYMAPITAEGIRMAAIIASNIEE